MEVRKGYKQTEVGVIPEDWDVLPISDLYDFQGGSQPPRHTFIFEEKTGYVRLLQIRDYKTDKYASYIPIPLSKRSCITTDIMIGRYGPPIFQILNGMEGSYNVALMKAVPSTKIIQKYGWYLLKQDKLFEFVEKLSQRSSGQTGVDLNELRKYLIPLPPTKSEQTAIATALSEADTLINSLEKLIEKKRAIKQGTMQELLIPKEGWEVKNLGEIAEFYSGGTPSTSNVSFYGGEISWITSSDLNKTNIESVEGRITKSGLDNSSAKMIKKETLLVALYGATAGVTAMSHIEAAINQAVLAIIPKNDNILFLFYQLTSLKNWILSTFIQGGQGNLSGNIFKELELYFPMYEEQSRIATILSDMDAEITLLEQKLGKYKLIKQGMMQELLTGKIRLI